MEGLPMCAELEMAAGSREWLNMMVLYCRKSASEDREVALHFNRLRGDRIVSFEDRMAFVHELESVMGVSVVAKTAVFLKETMEKEDSGDYHLENLENEAKQRAFEMDSFVQKLMRDGEDYRIAREINGVALELSNVVIEKDRFLEELDSLGVRPIDVVCEKRIVFFEDLEEVRSMIGFAKADEFLIEIQLKDDALMAQLQEMEWQMKLRAV
ncbi:hypothetical protein Tco_0588248 [Tanacetum coccineum]